MDKFAIATPIGGSDRFAVVLDTADGVSVIGVNDQGREWQRWTATLPESSRKTIEQVLSYLGPDFKIDGPSKLTPQQRDEFAILRDELAPSDAKDVEKALNE